MQQSAIASPSQINHQLLTVNGGRALVDALLRSREMQTRSDKRKTIVSLQAELGDSEVATCAMEALVDLLEKGEVADAIFRGIVRSADRRRKPATPKRDLVPLDSPVPPSRIDERPCDKCGRLVPPHNSALRFSDFLSRVPETADYEGYLFFGSHHVQHNRHLFPVIEQGAVVCEGSPSRAQYLPGQPDTRPAMDGYRKGLETPFNIAFAAFRRQFPEKTEK